MTKHAPNIDVERLLHLSNEVSRIAGSLARLSTDIESPARPTVDQLQSGSPEVSAQVVEWIISARRQRSRFVPQHDLFAEPAWDILLDLLRAEIVQQRVSITSLCIASGAPATTALRYINTMCDRGMIVRRSDPFDGRRVFIELSPDVSAALRRYFVEVVQNGAPK